MWTATGGRTSTWPASKGPTRSTVTWGGWRFEDITETAGVAAPDRFSTGAVFEDVDGDGDVDLLLTAMGGPNALYVNDGRGRFTEATAEAGLSLWAGSTSLALADVDGDGDLDLYVANYKKHTVRDLIPPHERTFEQSIERVEGTFRLRPPFDEYYVLRRQGNRLMRFEYGEADVFYRNEGGGRFTPVSFTGGAFLDADGRPLDADPLDWALAVRFQDVNGDGAPDLYVCNDFESPDHFWLNRGDGTFRAVSPLAVRKTSQSTMSVDFADIDRDGDLDFFLADMLSPVHARRMAQVSMPPPELPGPGDLTTRPQVMQNTLFRPPPRRHLCRGGQPGRRGRLRMDLVELLSRCGSGRVPGSAAHQRARL
ncbi:MAG: hypothetical protein KatS3mg043_1075 [Rhodothermaceae bacterium]|nr:MAG: hypothetical protein KatS3mg043_1075 [Rhodothermaceae bacterium]